VKENLESHIVPHAHHVTQSQRSGLKGQKPCILWFTGLSGSGKSTLANAVEARLHALGKHTYLLDGDNVRMGLNRGLGFSEADREENIRRIGEVAKLFVDAGVIVLSAFISPFRSDRKAVRCLVDKGEFIEIFVDTPLEICEARDPKGLYRKARSGEIPEFTGISSPYEVPEFAEIRLVNEGASIDTISQQVVDYLSQKGYLDAAND
jgi:adenylylsulfate kinase